MNARVDFFESRQWFLYLCLSNSCITVASSGIFPGDQENSERSNFWSTVQILEHKWAMSFGSSSHVVNGIRFYGYRYLLEALCVCLWECKGVNLQYSSAFFLMSFDDDLTVFASQNKDGYAAVNHGRHCPWGYSCVQKKCPFDRSPTMQIQ